MVLPSRSSKTGSHGRSNLEVQVRSNLIAKSCIVPETLTGMNTTARLPSESRLEFDPLLQVGTLPRGALDTAA